LPGNPAKVTVTCKADIVRISTSHEVIEEVTGKISSLSLLRILGNSSKLLDALQARERSSDCLPLKEIVFKCSCEGEQKPKAKRRLKLAGN